ncbi:MAG TPA: hypothetical protein VL576_03010 [Candidatus Paceibacterota bacterium]|jgi:hypothetical protein|nr:hypothetical protein [Candidatus Paceibacterota bacterium]
MNNFTQSRAFKIILFFIAGIVLLMAGFSLGEYVGFHKASFAYQNGNNFYRAFGPDASHGMSQFSDAHGVVGKVVSITLPTITVEDRDNTERTVTINDKTIIRYMRNTLTPNDIKEGSYIVAIGDPNTQSSQTAAVLIRILPPPPAVSSQTAQ